jgi:hypothetical protein
MQANYSYILIATMVGVLVGGLFAWWLAESVAESALQAYEERIGAQAQTIAQLQDHGRLYAWARWWAGNAAETQATGAIKRSELESIALAALLSPDLETLQAELRAAIAIASSNASADASPGEIGPNYTHKQALAELGMVEVPWEKWRRETGKPSHRPHLVSLARQRLLLGSAT